jgi:hypothetical protein
MNSSGIHYNNIYRNSSKICYNYIEILQEFIIIIFLCNPPGMHEYISFQIIRINKLLNRTYEMKKKLDV